MLMPNHTVQRMAAGDRHSQIQSLWPLPSLTFTLEQSVFGGVGCILHSGDDLAGDERHFLVEHLHNDEPVIVPVVSDFYVRQAFELVAGFAVVLYDRHLI